MKKPVIILPTLFRSLGFLRESATNAWVGAAELLPERHDRPVINMKQENIIVI